MKEKATTAMWEECKCNAKRLARRPAVVVQRMCVGKRNHDQSERE